MTPRKITRLRLKWVLCVTCSVPNSDRGLTLGNNVFHAVSAWPRTHVKGGLYKWEFAR